MDGPIETARRIIARCRELGFALAGVCPASPSNHEPEFREWLDRGSLGSMTWLASNVDVRLDPRRLLEGARSLILVADLYASRQDAPTAITPREGRIARYARGDDYHDVIKKRLHALCDDLRERHAGAEFRAFVDTAPILEREHAARAGLGWIGKHTLLIHPRLGSWMLLGGIATTLDLAPPPEQREVPDHCGTCTRCIDACPTQAITPHSVDASRCISELTIERRGGIDPHFFEPIGDNLFGCDICQEVCPHNSPRPEIDAELPAPNLAYAPRRTSFDLLQVLGWTEDDRRAAFARSSMKRAKLDMMKRNALIAGGNALRRAPDSQLRARIESIAADITEPELVRSTARAVLASLDRRDHP